MSTPARVAWLATTCLLLSSCMHAKFEREMRRPWSWQTSVVEDAIWTVEEAGLVVVKVVVGVTVTILTFGLINPLDDEDWSDDDDDWEDDGEYVPRDVPGPVQEPTFRGSSPPPSGRTRAVGTRRQR